MADIPEWAMEKAKDIAFDADCDWTIDGRRRGDVEEREHINRIALALVEAERRGIERAAQVADTYGHRDTGRQIAEAIRKLGDER